MGREIERKFLLAELPDLNVYACYRIEQGYIADGNALVRVRIFAGSGYITIKCNGIAGKIGVDEYEYEIPYRDAVELLKLTEKTLRKRRYIIPVDDHLFEVDVFEGPLEGLVVAEIELDSIDELFHRPHWLGEEVSCDSRYSNKNLLANGKP